MEEQKKVQKIYFLFFGPPQALKIGQKKGRGKKRRFVVAFFFGKIK